MSSIFGIGSSTDTTSTNTIGSLTSTVLGGTSGSALGDMALIRSGAYRKLLNAYYKNESSSQAKNTEVDKGEKVKLVSAKGDASALSSAAGKLMNTELTEENRESIKENLNAFVDSYNKLVDSGSAVDTASILRNTLWMTQRTSKTSGLLSDIGVMVGTDNKLKFDEEKFSAASLSTMKTLFNGVDSFMGKVVSKADTIATLAGKTASTGTHASAYTFSGSYDDVSVSSMIDTLG